MESIVSAIARQHPDDHYVLLRLLLTPEALVVAPQDRIDRLQLALAEVGDAVDALDTESEETDE